MMDALLSVANLSVAPLHEDGANRIVDDVSFAVESGEIFALVGESGSGKTITSRAVLGLLPPGTGVVGGRVLFRDRDLLRCPANEMLDVRGRHIGMVFQEPMTSLNPALTIGRQLTEAQQRHFGRDEQAARAAALKMLERLQVPGGRDCLYKYPHEFSGGLRQRILLAGVLALDPDLVIADEPTTALDVLIQQEVLELMVAAVRDIGSAVLLITHDLGVVAKYADRVGVMQHGKLLEQATIDDLFREQRDEYTRTLFEAIPQRRPGSRESGPAGDTLVRIDGLAVDYHRRNRLPWRKPDANRVLEKIRLTIGSRETVAVVGESGSGKTTLAKAMLGLVPAATGSIRLNGDEMTSMNARRLRQVRRRLQMVFQDPYSALDPRMRVRQIVAEGLRHARIGRQEARNRTDQALIDVELAAGYGERYPHQLSGGQRQRVNIARALVSEPDLIVADEPVSALDVTVQAGILRLLQRLQRARGFACLFISHDLAVVENVADRVVVIYRGQIVEHGDRDQIFDSPRHPYTCALLNAAPRIQYADGRYRLASTAAAEARSSSGFDYDGWQRRPTPRDPAYVEVECGHWVSCYPTSMNSEATS